MEGTRPILVEVQALVCQTSFNLPRRTAAGTDYNRINLLMAVIEKRLVPSIEQERSNPVHFRVCPEAYGGYRALFRRGWLHAISFSAWCEEPFWLNE